MRKIYIFTILLFIVSICSAQITSEYTKNKKALKLFDKALHFTADRNNEEATKKLLEAISIDSNFLEAQYMLGEIYDLSGKKELAYEHYVNAYNIDNFFDDKLVAKIAFMAYKNGYYNDAKKYIDIFVKNSDSTTIELMKIDKMKTFIDFAYEAFNNPVDFRPENLGTGVNTQYDEYWPSLSVDEKTLVFTRQIPSRYGSNNSNPDSFQEDLFVSFYDSTSLEYRKAFPMQSIINTQQNEGAQCISGDGNTCVVTCCNRNGGKGSCDLYIMFFRNGHWTEPINLTSINTSAWESNPSLSSDGRTLYFASNRPGGYGKIDIWKVEFDENWNAGPVRNLGLPINTEDNDVSPFIHPDGKTLYFASDGHPGMGGQDIFFSKLDENNKWTKPVNIGYPINTKGEERSMIVNAKGDMAMYASSAGGEDLDIFSFPLPKIVQPTMVTFVKGYIYNSKNLQRIGYAKCDLINIANGELETSIRSGESSGEYLVALPVNNDYAFNVTKEGYLFYSENFSLKNIDSSKPFYLNIPLDPIEIGKAVVLKNIFFDFDKSDLLTESYIELNKLLEYLNKNTRIIIEIGGHTDNSGSVDYNKKLSESRAKAVYDYLIKAGIDSNRLSYFGYGFSKPIADNNTEEGRALNRRTEFRIIDTK